MWVNVTSAKCAPENSDKAIEILDRDESRKPFQAAPGFQFLFVIESTESPGEMLSISFWDTEAEGQAFYNSAEYRQVVGGIASLLIARPERHFYTVRTQNQAVQASAA